VNPDAKARRSAHAPHASTAAGPKPDVAALRERRAAAAGARVHVSATEHKVQRRSTGHGSPG
jgi:hypothetical protein